jgi:hypothetical protein
LPWSFFVAHTTPSSGSANRSGEITPGQSLLDRAVGARASKNPSAGGHSRHRFLDFVCAGTQTKLATRVSIVARHRAQLQARHLVCTFFTSSTKEHSMNSIVYLIGAVVIIIAVLSFFGLR